MRVEFDELQDKNVGNALTLKNAAYPYALDDSCAFVAKHDWMWYGVAPVTSNHICVAQAGGHDLDQYFVPARASRLAYTELSAPGTSWQIQNS